MDKYQICSSAVLHEPLRPIELRYSCRLVALLQHTRAFCSSPSLGVLPPSSVTVLEALLTRSHLSAANIPRGFFVFVVTLKKKKLTPSCLSLSPHSSSLARVSGQTGKRRSRSSLFPGLHSQPLPGTLSRRPARTHDLKHAARAWFSGVWQDGRIIPDSWRQDLTRANGMINVSFIHSNNYRKDASATRDQYAELLCSSHVVPWKWRKF